jgi:UDP-N-acetyl-2-amino-2-deoxyglucuronate dehydrogenase
MASKQGATYALIGAAGYVAPRHLRAMKDTGGTLRAALDPADSVGIMDSYFPDARFFVEFERFDRYVDRVRREGNKIDYLTVCSPNYLHDAHVRFGLRSDADVICEKPLVLNSWNIDAIAEMERQTGRRVSTILQLRVHPAIQELAARIKAEPKGTVHDVDLTYITSRGRWYYTSWKGDDRKSGGIATNIGVHFFDMLTHVFGPVKENVSHHRAMDCSAGYLEFERARVRWFLSINARDLPREVQGKKTTYRSILMDGKEIEFSEGFTDLHTVSYREILAGRGFPLDEVRPSIEIVSALRDAVPTPRKGDRHPLLDGVLTANGRYLNGWPV